MTEARRNGGFRRRRLVIGALRAAGAFGLLGLFGGLLRGLRGSGPRSACIRPPGALDEDEFLARCIRCGRCADACPNQCIVAFTEESGKDFSATPGAGQYGTPVLFPRAQACILCQGVPGDHLLCTAACPTGALRLVEKTADAIIAKVDMGLSTVDEDLCYSWQGSSCGVCIRACPLEGVALRAGSWERPLVDPATCVGCGLCERACVRYPAAIHVTPRGQGGSEA